MATIELNEEVQSLLKAVNATFPGNVRVEFNGDTKAGYVRHDQSQQIPNGGDIVVQVNDLTAPNYTASHELIHMLMVMKGFPQVFFSLTTGTDQLDEQLMIMGTELYDIVAHFVVVSEQRKHGLIDDEIEALFLKGIQETIQPEPTPRDDQMMLRLMTLLDAFVFYGDKIDKVSAQLKADYPESFAAAEKLYRDISAKPIDSPFSMRRIVVKLFKQFDEQLKAWHLPPINNAEFTTLSSAFSKRQLRLEVRQLFELFHSEMTEKNSGRTAYVGFNRADGQNSFVIPAPEGNQENPEFFKELYSLTVEELFTKLGMPYILR